MGLFDKFKEITKQIKDENKNFGKTMARMNGSNFCGNVNRNISNGDFWSGSYLNIENGLCLIYGSSQEDYVFDKSQIISYTIIGVGDSIPVGKEKINSVRYNIELLDGKKAQVDVRVDMEDLFKSTIQK